MNYLRKKLRGLMACADFKGYLREATGAPPLTLTDCMGSDLVSLSVTGNAVQDGTPSPETPVEVQGVGERTGNLFDVSIFPSNSGGYVENGSIYVTGYPYQSGITPEDFLEMTGLKEGDTFTSVADYTQVAPASGHANSIQFIKKASAPEDISTIYIFGNRGRLKTTTIPTGFNRDNFYSMYIYGDGSTSEGVSAIWSNLAIYKGTYTTETMPPYEPYGYKIPVEVSGINLFDVSQITDSSVITRDGDKLILNNYACQSQLSPEDFLEMTGLQPGDMITTVRDISVSKGVANNITGRISFVGKSGGATYVLIESSALCTSVIPDDFDSEHYTSAYFYGALTPDENGDRIAEMSNIMIVKGTYAADTMPAYEPYHEPQMFNVYMDKPLYGQDGEPWSEVVYDGTEDWYTNSLSDDGTMIKYFLASQTKVGAAETRECACTHYPKTTINLASWFEQDTCQAWGFVFQKGWFGICVNAADYPTVDDWKAFLQAQYAAGTPVKAYFAAEGSAPAETKVPTYKGTTIISADTVVQPSSMTAQYYATKKED